MADFAASAARMATDLEQRLPQHHDPSLTMKCAQVLAILALAESVENLASAVERRTR